MYRLVETHAHLEEIEGLEQVISKSRRAGVIAIIAVGSGLESNRKVLALAQEYKDFVFAALGLHPWEIIDTDVAQNLDFIEAHINEAVAIGEVGLDYHKKVRARADKDLQKCVFQQLLGISKKYGKPVSVHSRYAWRDALTLVQESQVEKAVFHWYTGTSSVLRDIIADGYFVSATPAVEYHEEHRRAVKDIPLDRLLLETDSPVTYRRGTEFEYEARPYHLLKVLKGVSQLRGIAEARIAEVTTGNAFKLFGLPELAADT